MLRIIVLAGLIAGISACNGKSNSSEPEPSIFEKVESIARQDLSKNDAAAVSIAVYKEGSIVFTEAYGEKVKGRSETVNTDTLFQIGSTTKMFTALGISKLIDQGTLNTSTQLTTALPDVNLPSENQHLWSEITIQQLLTHNTGLPDRYAGIEQNNTLLNYMQTVFPNANPLMAPAGKFYNYSNPNWSYLGAIIEYVTQKNYSDWVEQNVFEALGMNKTGFGVSTASENGNYALGVFEDGTAQTSLANQITPQEALRTSPHTPAGSQTWSTPTEMIEMAKFLMHGNTDVLSNEQRQAMTAKQIDMAFSGGLSNTTGLADHYGYGIFVSDGFLLNEEWYNEAIWDHAGNTQTHTSMFWILPDHDIAVAILSSGVFDNFSATMLEILKALEITPSPNEEPDIDIDTGRFEVHVGTYILDGLEVHVELQDDELILDIPNALLAGIEYEPELIPFAGSTFIANIDDDLIDLTFFPEVEDGESVYVRNRNFVAIKQGYGLE